MSRITKITEELKWVNYSAAYFIGNRTVEELLRNEHGEIVMKNGQPIVQKTSRWVNELQEAIDQGIFDELVKQCADQYHGGDVQSVLYALKRNLDSQKSNMKKREYAQNAAADEERLATMLRFVEDRRETKGRSAGRLPQWAYGPEQIDAIDDPAQLQKVINSINDVCANKFNNRYIELLGENYVEVAKVNREYARKRKAELEAAERRPDPALLAKLAKGAVKLTAAEAEALLKLLGQ